MQLLNRNGVLFCFCYIPSLWATLVCHEKRDGSLRGVIDRQPIDELALLPMRIGLRQNAYAELNAERWIMNVSDPDSPYYGHHWSQKEVIEAFKPSSDTIANVTTWLNSHGITEFTHSENKMWFAFDVPAKKAESLLGTKYFEHQTTAGGFEASCDYYYLPPDLQTHIHYITPGIKGSDVTGRTARSRAAKTQVVGRSRNYPPYQHMERRAVRPLGLPPYTNDTSLENCDKMVTPACIRQLYNFSIPDQDLQVNPNNTMGIFEARGPYWQGSLDLFYRYFAPWIPAGTSPIYHGILHDQRKPLSSNASLYPQAETDLDLECAIPIIYPQRTSIFNTLAAGNNFLNSFFDAIDGSYCSYGQRVNSSQGGLPQCGVLKPTNVLSVSYGLPENSFSQYWQERQCNEFLKLGLQGVSVFICSQDSGVGSSHLFYQNSSTNYCDGHSPADARLFMPQFPAACPWVTSVGATEIHPNNTVFQPEIGAEWPGISANGTHTWEGSSGGGFSLQFTAPRYQRTALSSFFDNHNPPWPYFYNGHFSNTTGRYNRDGRGIPDISAIGSAIADFDGRRYVPERGTSAATPIVAAMFNRIIEERLRVGKSLLGFVNPTLYKHPNALNDILKGKNGFCTKDDGFEAVEGWDPVTGLGTPKYDKLLDIFMRLP